MRSSAVLIAGVAFWLLRPAPKTMVATPTVAVMPFDPLGDGEDLRVFGDAVAEQIFGTLSDNQVQAISRAASATLRGADRDEAAERLGAAFIVDGTVTHGDAGLHVTVHLDHVPTHVTLWTGAFDQDGADQTALQTQVAAKIVDVIRAAEQAHLPGRAPDQRRRAFRLHRGVDACAHDAGTAASASGAGSLPRRPIAQAPTFRWAIPASR